MPFNEVVATQAAVYLLRIAGGQMSYMKLIRLLYLADRKALLDHGRAITTDSYVMTSRGPVLANLLERASGAVEHSFWSDHIAPVSTSSSGHEVSLTHGADEGELPVVQTEILDQVFKQYRSGNLGHLLAALPECRGRKGAIEIADILRAGK